MNFKDLEVTYGQKLFPVVKSKCISCLFLLLKKAQINPFSDSEISFPSIRMCNRAIMGIPPKLHLWKTSHEERFMCLTWKCFYFYKFLFWRSDAILSITHSIALRGRVLQPALLLLVMGRQCEQTFLVTFTALWKKKTFKLMIFFKM